MTKEEFIKKSRNIHGYKYEYINIPDKINYKSDVNIFYNGVEYSQKVNKHLMGKCPEKNTPTKTQKQFLEECKKIWDDKYDYTKTIYKGALKKIIIIYDDIEYEQVAISHLRGLCVEKKINKEIFLIKAKRKWGNKYDYSKINFIDSKTSIDIIYEGIIYKQTPLRHLINEPEGINRVLDIENFIKKSNIIHNNKYNYDKVIYINSNTKIIITCPIHEDFNQVPNSHLSGNGCPNCHESKGEIKINRFLDRNNIVYERQKKFDDCKNIFCLPFDFYIPSIRTCIEFDGQQHYKPLDFFGGEEAYEKLKINDKIKEEYCEDNYINLIRIKYDVIDIDNFLYNNLKMIINI